MEKVVKIYADNWANLSGTSFHDSTFDASVSEITELLGEECGDGTINIDDKVQHEWWCKCITENREVFYITIYDWKEYREYTNEETINWHIGGKTKEQTDDALEWIKKNLNR